MSSATAIERAELLAVARELARHELIPRASELDAGDPATVAQRWRQIAQLGFDRALLDESCGGAGIDERDFLAVVEEVAVGDGGVALSVLLSNAALVTLEPDELALIDEGARWVLVPVRPGTELTTSQGRLDIHVPSALGAFDADGIVLLSDRLAPIAIRADAPELERRRDRAQMGLRAAPAAAIALSGIKAVSEVADAGGVQRLTLLRAGVAAIACGIARRAYEMALDYAQARHQGGVPIIAHDAVADMLAAMAVRLGASLPTALDDTQALAAKITHTNAAVATTTDAVQVFGGIGYMRETGGEKLMRDAKYCQLFPEPNWIAQQELLRLVQAEARESPEARPGLLRMHARSRT